MTNDPAYTHALAAADRQFSHVEATNAGMVNIAAGLLRKNNDTTAAWAELGMQLMRGADIQPGSQAQFLAECLSATYIEQAQARIDAENR